MLSYKLRNLNLAVAAAPGTPKLLASMGYVHAAVLCQSGELGFEDTGNKTAVRLYIFLLKAPCTANLLQLPGCFAFVIIVLTEISGPAYVTYEKFFLSLGCQQPPLHESPPIHLPGYHKSFN